MSSAKKKRRAGVDLSLWSVKWNKPPSGEGRWQFLIGYDTKTFNGPYDRAVRKAWRACRKAKFEGRPQLLP